MKQNTLQISMKCILKQKGRKIMNDKPIECIIEEDSLLIDDTSEKDSEPNYNCSVSLPGKAFHQNLAAFFELPLPEILFDPSIEETLRNYLDAQARIDKLRAEFADRLCLPYICQIEQKQLSSPYKLDFYFNGKKIIKLPIYKHQSTYRAITQTNFKTILLTLGTPYAKWISNNDNIFIDLLNFALDNNIQFSTTDSIFRLNNEEKKNN